MTNQELFSYVDHTLLKPEATPEQIAALCAEAAEHGTASVCVNGSYVALAKKLLDGKAKVCAVIGFPLGAMSTAAKAFEAAEAIRDGAVSRNDDPHRTAQGRQYMIMSWRTSRQ